MLQLYPGKLVITRGKAGVSAEKNGKIIHLPAFQVDVIDTTGAGDTFQGAFCVRIAKGDTLEDALQFANIAAALSTEKIGAQSGMPTEQEVRKRLSILINISLEEKYDST